MTPLEVDEPVRYSVADLRRFIANAFADLQALDPEVRELLGENEPFAEWEADWFLRGCREAGLFTVRPTMSSGGFAGPGT